MPETQGFDEGSGILDRIVAWKRREVESLLKEEKSLRAAALETPVPMDLRGAFLDRKSVTLMAEVKRRSPGAGAIRPDLVPRDLARAYEVAGAGAVSVLTDRRYFGGSMDDLRSVKEAVSVPVLRKDFVIHPIQVLEARAAGADGILLIARILTDQELHTLGDVAADLGLATIVEVHGPREVERALESGASLMGINNRNLQSFATNLEVTLDLLPLVPSHLPVISESGIRNPGDVDRLGEAGVEGILVGEALLRAEDPGEAAAELVGRRRVPRSHEAVEK